ncbi:MAG: hypothetical protein AAF235_03325 [Planctomycetota bacterium]
MSSEKPIILFTGFEPSGDDHAAAVARELLSRRPGLDIRAWGGPRLKEAGVQIIQETGKNAVMGVPGLSKIREHRRINADVEQWLDAHKGRVALHVPVDSPAANFPICEMAKRRGIRVLHLVAPQVWAWGGWRIKKLRRLTDFVCCLLPFEEAYFSKRGVPARFVGHPLFDHPLDEASLDAAIAAWPTGEPRVAIMPGSRPAEIEKNFPLLIAAYRSLAADYSGIAGAVAATTPEVAVRVREIAAATRPAGAAEADGWPESLEIVIRQTDETVRWCDIALAVSGTVTLQIARQLKPMVIVFRTNRLLYESVARWLVQTEHFSLPNLIAGEEIVPELIPHFGGSEPILRRVIELIENETARQAQIDAMRTLIVPKFDARSAAQGAADAIERLTGLAEAPRSSPDPSTDVPRT